jgi:hypothetical protein
MQTTSDLAVVFAGLPSREYIRPPDTLTILPALEDKVRTVEFQPGTRDLIVRCLLVIRFRGKLVDNLPVDLAHAWLHDFGWLVR